jgi:deoxyribodipyrimidine photo-lyase
MLRLTDHLQTNNAVLPIAAIRGGYIAAKKRLTYFTQSLLSKFQEFRSDPATDVQSYLSPYLHFGQISMREVLNTALMYAGISKPEFGELILHYKPGTHPEAAINGLLEMFEQGVIRRELSYNYCWFQPDYDSYFALPRWAIASLTDHLPDSRPYLYGLEALETACTHDPYWNAAQQEMLHTGMMHGYMRMYWGKKILLWSKAPEDAFYTALYLNNKYSLDGRDANSFAGVAWCFGLHDRPWGSKPVFGNVRCMNEQGLTRKFDMQTYLKRIKRF